MMLLSGNTESTDINEHSSSNLAVLAVIDSRWSRGSANLDARRHEARRPCRSESAGRVRG